MLTRLKLVSWLAQTVNSGCGSTKVVIFVAIRQMDTNFWQVEELVQKDVDFIRVQSKVKIEVGQHNFPADWFPCGSIFDE